MHNVVIIGAGFAGRAAAERLAKTKATVEITLIDKKASSDFLPLLPDTLGRGIEPEILSYKIEEVARRLKIRFVNEQVRAIDLEKQEVLTASGSLVYDYLVISSGSESNFYGSDFISQAAYKLDEVSDARRLIQALAEEKNTVFIVAGGGYTGIETATNLSLFLSRQKIDKQVIIVERAPEILGALPRWIREYVSENLKRINVDVLTNSAIEKIEGGQVFLSGGKTFSKALVIWAAGVKTADFIRQLNSEKNPQGRLKVDAYLRLNQRCFAIGDAACFLSRGTYLRMAVQFAIFQGYLAAENIKRSIQGRKLKKYQPIDLGYIIPMANNLSCGRVLGINLTGRLPTGLHFLMCLFRLRGVRNKAGLIRGLVKGAVYV